MYKRQGLDTDRILALGPDARLNRYSNARWPDHLPEVLSSVLQRSMTATGRFSKVLQSDHAVGEHGWLLKLEVQQFYGIQDSSGATSSVRVEVAGSLYCNGGESQVSAYESRTVVEERLSAVVAAHQASLDAVTRQLTARIDELCF